MVQLDWRKFLLGFSELKYQFNLPKFSREFYCENAPEARSSYFEFSDLHHFFN